MMKWKIVHESDDENGNPTLWAAEINHPKHGKFCWISDTGKGYRVEVQHGDDFVELVLCKSLASARRWVSRFLV